MFTISPLVQGGAPQDLQLRQWQLAYHAGARTMPRAAALTALGHAVVAWQQAAGGAEWRGLAAAAVLTLAIVPFTFAFIMPTNNALEREIASEIKTMPPATAVALLQKWARWNLFRSLLPLVGAACAVWNLVA